MLWIFLGLLGSHLVGQVPQEASTGAANSATKNVLFISSVQLSNTGYREYIHEALKAGVSGPIRVFDEYTGLDTFSGEAYETSLLRLYNEKYGHQKIDVIIVLAPTALDFVVSRHFLQDVPVVTCYVPQRLVEAARKERPEITGAIHPQNGPLTLDLMLSLFPKTRRVHVVLGASVYERRQAEFAAKVLQSKAREVAIDFLNDLSLGQMQAKLKGLGKDELVLFCMLDTDAAGQHFTTNEPLNKLSDISARPIFGLNTVDLGEGILGGILINEEQTSKAAAEVARLVLAGKRPTEIPLQMNIGAAPMFDWRELRRWGVSEHALPAGSLVQYRTESLWDKYWKEISGGVVLFLLETSLIGALIIQLRRRKRIELELKESEQDYRHLFEMANDPILIFEPETELVLEVNLAACRTYGFNHDEFVGMDLKTLTKDVPQGTSQLQKLMASGLYQDFETIQRNKQGEEIHFLVNSSVVTYRGRKAILSLNRDIGDRKRLEAHLQQSQKMESLGTLSGGIAHNMNNVLGAILGLASANLEIQPPGSPTYRSFETIAKAATRGGEMVKGLLTFARQGQAEKHILDVNALLEEEAKLLEHTTISNIRLVAELEPGLHPIQGDASALTHAFMNLCVNAVDAMPEAGSLILRTRNVDVGWIEVEVEDTGAGMPKEVLARAMEPFFTTKGVGKGTGLGLSMVYSTVKAHQGQIEIQSTPGHGTLIKMRFPACHAATKHAQSEVRSQAGSPAHVLNVLLIDDDELIQSSMSTVIEGLGHSVVTLSTGEEALAAIQGGLNPNLVILDMNMPGLGGSGTLPRLRVVLPEVPIILSTGRADQSAVTLASAHSGVTLMAKPFGLRELQRHLESIGIG